MTFSGPLVGVMGDKIFEGANHLTDNVRPMEVLTLQEAMEREWVTDAHFTTYSVSGLTVWPRCNKPVLGAIREAGYTLLSTCLALDYDNPGHGAWDEPKKEAFQLKLVELADYGLPLALGWTYLYYTKHGARLVYELTEPVHPEDSEALVRGLVRDFLSFGMEFDTQCADWTRVFRLPKVLREGKRTSDSPFFEHIHQPGVYLDPSTIVPGERVAATEYGGLRTLSDPMPDPQEALGLLWEQGKSGGKRSAWYKAAKKRLQGRECYSVLFESAPLAPAGSRNSTIQRLVGEALSILFGSQIYGTSMGTVFAIFFEPLQQLNLQDSGEPEDFVHTGWQAILTYWARELSKYERETHETQVVAAETDRKKETLASGILRGAREWCEDIPQDENEAGWWLNEHLIAATPQQMHVMTPSGYYDPVGVSKTLLHARIRELRLDSLIPLTKESRGELQPRPAQEIIDAHSTVICSLEGAVGAQGTYIRNIGKKNATLIHRMYKRRTDVPGEWNENVDMHLSLLGSVNKEALVNWSGHALAFEDGPICALSIKGWPGCGKKLFAQGFAECIDTGVTAGPAEFGRFKSLLLHTPFLVVNEGLSSSINNAEIADTFRQFVSGDPLYIEEKFKAPILIRNPLRLIFTTNNTDVISTLTGGKDLSPEDREALAVRILHIDSDRNASDWLRDKGGLEFTRGWIAGDDGSPSALTYAKHLMYLYEHRNPVPRGNRLLVEGNATEELVRHMSARGGSSPLVIEVLIRMIESDSHLHGLHVENDKVFVTTSAVVDFFRTGVLGNSVTNNLNQSTVSNVLKGIVVSGSSDKPRSVETRNGPQKARWREIDSQLLHDEAIENGYQCTKLLRIVKNRYADLSILNHTERQIQKEWSDVK